MVNHPFYASMKKNKELINLMEKMENNATQTSASLRLFPRKK